MEPKNGYIQVEPLKQNVSGLITESSEYTVIKAPVWEAEVMENEQPKKVLTQNFIEGEVVVVEEQNIIPAMILGKRCYFVKEENVVASYGPEKSSVDTPAN